MFENKKVKLRWNYLPYEFYCCFENQKNFFFLICVHVNCLIARSTGAMGKKKTEDNGKPSNKDAPKDGKKEKLSVSAMLANMDQKSDRPKKGSSSSSTITSSKPNAKSAPKLPSYTAGIDLPPSDDEEDGLFL